ncbi:MAG: hypothetical protein R3Y59_09870 [bacterium]
MFDEKLKKGVVTILIPSILLPSCTPYDDYFIYDDISYINRSLQTQPLGNSIAVPIINDSKDQEFLCFINKLAADIIKNPLIAQEFAKDPKVFSKAYGFENLNNQFR